MDDDFSTTDNDPADDSPAYSSSGTVTSSNAPPAGDVSSATGDFSSDDSDADSTEQPTPKPNPASPSPEVTNNAPRRRNKIFGEDLAQRGIDYYTNLDGGANTEGGMRDADAGQTIRTIQPNFQPPSWSFDRTTSTDAPPSAPMASGPAPLDPRQFPLTAARQKLEIAQQAADDSRQQTSATLRALGVPVADNSGRLLDLGNADPDSLRAYVDDAFDQESASADATARRMWSFGGTNLTASAQALRADIERRRGQALAVLGDHQQALSDVQAASDEFDQVRAPYMAQNLQDLAALNARRAAAGQPPVPPPDHWVRLAALAAPPASPTGDNSTNGKPDDLRTASTPAADSPAGTDRDTASAGVTDETGAPLTSYDPSTGIGYDASGNPRKVTFDPATGAPHLSGNLYDTAPLQEDEKGNVYRAPEGLAWQWSGVDPEQAAKVVAAMVAAGQKPDLQDPATAAGMQWLAADARRKLDAAQPAQQAAAAALQSMTDRLRSLGVPLVDKDGLLIDFDTEPAEVLRQHLEDYFARQSASPPAMERATDGQGNSDFTPAAQAFRQSLEARKTQALQTLTDYLQTRQTAQSANDELGKVSGPVAAMLLKQLLGENAAREAAGQPPVPIPKVLESAADDYLGLPLGQEGLSRFGHIPGLPEPVSPSLHPPANPPTPEEVQQLLAAARQGQKIYGVDDQGIVTGQDGVRVRGLQQAVQDGLLDVDQARQMMPLAQLADSQYRELAQVRQFSGWRR